MTTPVIACPRCHHQLRGSVDINGHPRPWDPQPGQLHVCGVCSGVMVTLEDKTLAPVPAHLLGEALDQPGVATAVLCARSNWEKRERDRDRLAAAIRGTISPYLHLVLGPHGVHQLAYTTAVELINQGWQGPEQEGGPDGERP